MGMKTLRPVGDTLDVRARGGVLEVRDIPFGYRNCRCHIVPDVWESVRGEGRKWRNDRR